MVLSQDSCWETREKSCFFSNSLMALPPLCVAISLPAAANVFKSGEHANVLHTAFKTFEQGYFTVKYLSWLTSEGIDVYSRCTCCCIINKLTSMKVLQHKSLSALRCYLAFIWVWHERLHDLRVIMKTSLMVHPVFVKGGSSSAGFFPGIYRTNTE